MNSKYPKKQNRGRTKPGYRNQENLVNYSNDKRKHVCDLTFYYLTRFLMGNEVQIITNNEKLEGVLRAFDNYAVGLSKVFVYDLSPRDGLPILKETLDLKEVLIRDILLLKRLNVNGKLENVLLDQEISQRKQTNKPLLNEDKNLVPYFDEDDAHYVENKDDDYLNTSLKENQDCWYHPEDMLKDNEERFHVKSTFSEEMEQYTTQIDKNDPLLQEKMERAERLAREIENDTGSKRNCALEDDDQDEELRFGAVAAVTVASTSVNPVPLPSVKPEPAVPATVTTIPSVHKLNPNAPEFRPRQKPDEMQQQQQLDHVDDTPSVAATAAAVANMQMNCEVLQQQQQQQLLLINRFNNMTMSAAHAHPQQAAAALHNQAYPTAQRMVPNQIPLQISGPNQYVLQQYQASFPSQMMQHVFPTRPVAPTDAAQTSHFVYFTPQPMMLSSEHLPPPAPADSTHMYPTIDAATAVAAAGSLLPHNVLPPTAHQMRPQIIQPTNIPIIQTQSHLSIHQPQPPQPQPQQPPQPQTTPQLNSFYSQHFYPQMIAQHIQQQQQQQPGGHSNFQQLIINQQPPPQLHNGAPPTIQGFIQNGGRQ